MANRLKLPTAKSDPSWFIYRIVGARKGYLGLIRAPTAEAAIEVAIEEFKLTSESRSRLIAERRG
jgi:hypothetical protein